jgi:hypothetical protein
MVHRTGWQSPGEVERRPPAPSKGYFLLSFRKNNPFASVFRQAATAQSRPAGGSARDVVADAARRAMTTGARTARGHGARFAASRPAQLTAGIAAAATIGTLAAAVPWAGTAASAADAAHGGHAPTIGVVTHTTADRTSADHHTSASHTSASHTSAGHASAGQASAGHATAKAASTQPETIYDSVAPTAIPAGQQVATYADGPYQATGTAVAGRGNVLWIDTNGTNTHAQALDVEPGDATPAEAASWVSAKLSASPRTDAIVYTFEAEWGSVQSNIDALPSWMQSHVKYWIADPTGTPHIVPGASATQWYWGSSYDISMAQPGFFSSK